MITTILLSYITPYVIGGLALIAVAYALYRKVSFTVICVGAAIAMLAVAYTKGASDAGYAIEIAQLEAEKKATAEQLKANEEIIKKYEADAKLDEASDAQREELLRKLLEQLAHSDGSCTLSPADIDGVRKLHGG